MSIFNLFSGNPPAQQPVQGQTPQVNSQQLEQQPQQGQPTPPGNIPQGTGTDNNPPQQGNGQQGQQQVTANEPKEPEHPIDKFASLWETKPNNDEPTAIVPELDQAKLQEVIGKANFTNNISQDTLAKIANGGEDAVQASLAAINEASQQTMLQSTIIANKLVEQAINNMQKVQEQQIPKLVKDASVQAGIKTINPLLTNPAVLPVVEATKTQLTAQYPNATPDEIAQMTEQYIVAIGETFNPTKQNQQTDVPKEQDFSSWLN